MNYPSFDDLQIKRRNQAPALPDEFIRSSSLSQIMQGYEQEMPIISHLHLDIPAE
jgi:hypothetical protein